MLRLLAFALIVLASPITRADLRAGAAVVDVTPTVLPVLVNGGMLSRSVDKVKSPVHARALVLADGATTIAIVVVDSCMMNRTFLDEAKQLASRQTDIAPHHMLISATHAHSAPSSMGCLGTDADPRYVPLLREKIVEAIIAAQRNLESARVGWAKAYAPSFTALRQWIRRPDRLAEDPFGNLTVRANMHAGSNWDDVTGEAGPEDPDLTLLSVQATNGRPLAVLGNFSMHYFGDQDVSADYFGLFCEGLKARLSPDRSGTHPPFVGMLSHGCSGDIYRVDYKIPAGQRPNPTLQEYADGLVGLAVEALQGTEHRSDQTLSMAERRIPLSYRVPDKQRLEWARRVVAEMGDRLAKTTTEVYAREQVLLNEWQRTEVVVQALRIGDMAIASVPTETYAITGLKVKAASPLPKTMVIELANGGDGYIPPPEQHPFGGYNTWPARSAGLEVNAEPKIAESAIALLESVSDRPRRFWKLPAGPAALAILESKPLAYWRLNEFTGPHAIDATAHGHHAVYEAAMTYYLEGPWPKAFCDSDTLNRAPHAVGGRLRAILPEIQHTYSVSLWFWNGMPVEGRAVAGWLFSRGHDHGLGRFSDHVGVGGGAGNAGRLIFLLGHRPSTTLAGKTSIPRWEWHHLAMVRSPNSVRVYLDGMLEIDSTTEPSSDSGIPSFFLGGRSDNDSNWEGRLDEVAVFDRVLSPAEITRFSHP